MATEIEVLQEIVEQNAEIIALQKKNYLAQIGWHSPSKIGEAEKAGKLDDLITETTQTPEKE